MKTAEEIEKMAEQQVIMEGWGKYEGTAEQVGIKNSFIAGVKYATQKEEASGQDKEVKFEDELWNDLGYKFKQCRRRVEIEKDTIWHSCSNPSTNIMVLAKEETKILSAWLAVVEFIKWYNNQKP